MACTRQKPSKIVLLLSLAAFMILPAVFPLLAASDSITDYDTDVDVCLSSYSYIFNASDIEYHESIGDNLPDIKTGIYFGAYMSGRSRLFSFFFNMKNVYSMYEFGCALNPLGGEDSTMLSFPLTYDLAYRIKLSEKTGLFPFVGGGFNLIRIQYDNQAQWQFFYMAETGLEVKYRIWDTTNLKLRISYGVIFLDQVESGYMHILKVRFPVPFIP
jgi:hypothetical protein